MRCALIAATTAMLAIPALGQVRLAEVMVIQLGEGTPWDSPETIVLQNHGDEAADLTGWSLTTSPGLEGPGSVDAWSLPAGTTLPAGERLKIWWSADLADPRRLSTGQDSLARLSNTAGDLALRRPSGIEHYLQWGAEGQAQEAEAAAAGTWQQGRFLEILEVGGLEGFGYDYRYDEDAWGEIHFIDAAVQPAGWGEAKSNALTR